MITAVDTTRVLVTIPLDVKNYLMERARYNGASQSAEIVRSIRERMERDAAIRDRAATAVAAECRR